MPQYHYKAYRPNGTIDKSIVTADSEQSAYQRLSKSGKFPFELSETQKKSGGSRARLSLNDILPSKPNDAKIFSELAVLLSSGFTITQAIGTMRADTDNQADAKRLEAIATRLREGSSVSDAFRLDNIHDEAIALIKAGESSGSLPQVMTAIANRFEQSAKRRSEMQEALLYPAFLILMLIVAVLVLAFYLVPAIEPVFESSPEGVPTVVAILSGLRDMLNQYGAFLAIFLLALSGFAALSKSLRSRLHALVDYLPVIGSFRRQQALANYLSALHLLLSNGVPMKESLHLAVDSLGNRLMADDFHEVGEQVGSGSRLHAALEQSGRFSASLIAYIRIGEESNNLTVMLERGATSLILKQKLRMDRLMKFLTPAITITIGLMIGTLVTAVMSTLLSVNELAVQ